jgi:predicted PhzF superfamily epimerase YddE/YHI9
MLVYRNQKEVESLVPDVPEILKLGNYGVIVTAPGDKSDFVSRFFIPAYGILEDPVTGSAHTTLIPYWAARLGKKSLSAIQVSQRKGFLNCVLEKDRVRMSGKGKLYLRGEIAV